MYQYTKVHFVKRTDYYDVIIYYSKNGEKFRPKTGVQVSLKNLNTDKEGNQTISKKHPNLDSDLEKIREVQDKVEKLIKDYKEKYKDKPPVDWLEKAYEKKDIDLKKDLNDVLCYWDEFIKEKRQITRNEGTIKRYENLATTLRKFREVKNYNLSFEVLDQQFFNDFLSYMVSEHEYVRNRHQRAEDAGVIPEVGLSNETAIKRLKDLVEYLKFCSVEYDIEINPEKIKKYIKLSRHKLKVKPLSTTQKWELTLTPEEIEFVINLKHYEPDFWESLSANQKRYLDIEMFMCLQGTAPIDTKSIKRTDIRQGKIMKERAKSDNEFRVELDPIAAEILERHNYDLNFTDQTLNEELKRLFVTIFELYRPRYEKKYKEPYQLIYSQKMRKGDREVYKIQHKGLFVELTTGRRSFISNLADLASQLGLKEAMDKSGHVKVETWLGYVHQRQDGKKSKGGLFGIKRV
jgi:hypothetical protein